MSALINLSFAHAYTWPDPFLDPIEDLYVQTDFSSAVVPCNSGSVAFQTAAQWLRTAYHDMATYDITNGTGGLDASIGFELDRAENVGSGFDVSLGFFAPFQTPTTSMADLIALGAIVAVRSCGGSDIDIPLRIGRIDAVEAGPPGVPSPTEDLATHTSAFARQGFNVTEMIGLVACGHTIGSVHPTDFPTITEVINPGDPLDPIHFDSTFDKFDNKIATDLMSNHSQDPLVVGANDTNSDLRIFNADGGASMKDFANSNSFFLSTCQNLLERMINTVPSGVELSDPIIPVTVKPQNIVLQFNDDQTLSLSGDIRLLSSTRDASRTVILHMTQRNRSACANCQPIATTLVDASQQMSFFGNLSIYQFNQTISTATGISSFTIEIRESGVSTIVDNGGNGYPIPDSVAFQPQHSCLILGSGPGVTRNFTVAVRDDAQLSSVTMQWHNTQLVPGSVALGFSPNSTPLMKGSPVGTTGYSIYSTSAVSKTFFDYTGGTYDVSATDSTGNQLSFTGSKIPFCFT